ncbi:Putative small ribosomal subunit protein bS21 [Colletotrichum destructivum]|uniref:Small ribosomal subunit protein bS21 n=1 Tax=Colletotrichum destructivum TaxID=34406 RepID=A0AAX4IQS4_9PEZI|nr:Putative small ribosomal subunit protein bS21 [Colletotrichum destructivum]
MAVQNPSPETAPRPAVRDPSLDLLQEIFWKPSSVGDINCQRSSTSTPIVCAYTMASEIGLLSRRLLTSCTIRNPSLRAPLALRQSLWALPRTFATSSALLEPPRSGGSRSAPTPPSSRPAATRITPPPPPPAALFGAAPASREKKPDSPFMYDATSDVFDISKIIAMESDEFMKKHYPTGQQEPPLRTRPSTGRTIHLGGNIDLPRALKNLDYQCRKNKLKRQWHSQRFHERPGKKRKRLVSERWRARFKEGFQATVQRVQELKNQGW